MNEKREEVEPREQINKRKPNDKNGRPKSKHIVHQM